MDTDDSGRLPKREEILFRRGAGSGASGKERLFRVSVDSLSGRTIVDVTILFKEKECVLLDKRLVSTLLSLSPG